MSIRAQRNAIEADFLDYTVEALKYYVSRFDNDENTRNELELKNQTFAEKVLPAQLQWWNETGEERHDAERSSGLSPKQIRIIWMAISSMSPNQIRPQDRPFVAMLDIISRAFRQ